MNQTQQTIIHFRMLRAATKTLITGLQVDNNPNLDEIDRLLDTVSKLSKEIEYLENQLKTQGN
jgi:hypothetical protein